MENYFVIGNIVNTQGIKGEVRVMPAVDDVSRFELLDHIFVDRKGNIKEYEVENVRFHKQFVLLKLKDVDDMTTAETLKGTVVKITEDMAVPCEEDEYYIRDLYDMEVITVEGERLGIITDVIFTGANDVYAVKNEEGKEILIPAIKDCIIKVDIENNTMTVKLLEGLR
ncbi:MAG: ribosome maturation factor RimM [Clostridia bacterium]|nr:ribosome maturation factor RimM [Clostridia bacterium]